MGLNEQEMQIEPEFPDFYDTSTTTTVKTIQEKTKEMKKSIMDYFKDHKFHNLKIHKEDGILNVTISIELLNGHYGLVLHTKINVIDYKWSTTCYISEPDGRLIHIREKGLIPLVCRYCLRLNASFRFGCFCINPFTGLLNLKFNSIMSPDQQMELRQGKSESIANIFKVCLQTAHYSYQFHLFRILYLGNLLNIKVFPLLDHNKVNYRKLPEGFASKLKELSQIVKYRCNKQLTEQESRNYTKYLELPRSQNPTPILIEIILGDNESLANFMSKPTMAEGGFSEIRRVDVTYKIKPTDPLIKRTMLIKTDKKENHISHEVKILQELSNKRQDGTGAYCPFIAQYYFSKQPGYENVLFLDFYQHGSLDSFKLNNSLTISVSTKLYILWGLAAALKYMHSYYVYHIDVKQANVIISKSYLPKLIDFGESYSANCVTNKYNFNPGRTLPFAAPELMSNINKYGPQLDVFSFGVVLYELMFDRYPVDFKRSDLSSIEKRYKDLKYTVRCSDEYIKEQGHSKVMMILKELSLRCLQPQPQDRPHMDWIVVLLRELLLLMDKLY